MVTIFLTLMLVTLGQSCEWLKSIQEKKVEMKVLGAGLHRTISVNTRITSVQRFSECRLVYEFDIPNGAFIDTDSINSTLISHKFFSKETFDVEAMQAFSQRQKVLILSTNIIRRAFVIEDNLQLPVHIRYHSARDGVFGEKLESQIIFVTPTLSVDCPNDYKLLELSKCSGRRSYNSFGLKSDSPSWVLLEPLDKIKSVVSIPVGNTSITNYIVNFTIATLIISFLLIFTTKSKSD